MDKYKVVDAEQLDADLTEIADEVRILADTLDTMTIDEITSNIAQANADVSTQADLIAQIKTALEGKAAGNGSEIIAEIASLIDQSGVLGTTDGTVEDKVGELIEYANFKHIIQQSLYKNTDNSWAGALTVFKNTNIKDVSMFDLSKIKWLSQAFMNTKIEELNLDLTNVVYMDNMCEGCVDLKKITIKNMTSQMKSLSATFAGCVSLVSIEGDLNVISCDKFFYNSTQSSFYNCGSLEEIRFIEGCIKRTISFGWSPYLTAESIQSILGGLNSEVTGQTLTIPRNAVKKAFETSEGANDGDTSAEWLALKDTKPNWTITLS